MDVERYQTLPSLEQEPPDVDDYVARWFAENQRTGDYMGIRFGRIAAGQPVPDWLYLPHWRYDGVGGFGHILRERGADGLGSLPQMKHPMRPGLWREVRAMLRLQRRMKTRAPWYVPGAAWLDANRARSSCNNAVGYRVLSQGATLALKRRAEKQQISLNSLLLWGLDRLARQTFLPRTAFAIDWSTQVTQWMIPVNLRGGVTLQRDTANHLGLMDALLPAAATPEQVHAQIRDELAQAAHFAAWRLMGLSRWLSPRTVAAVVNKEAARGVVHTGVFSNLGDWGMALPSQEAEAMWLFCPQTTRKVPVAAGAICWAGRLALTLQFHPMFDATDDLVSAWAGRWLELLDGNG